MEKIQYDSKVMKENVLRARGIQKERFKDTEHKYNSDIKGRIFLKLCRVSNRCTDNFETLL